MNIYLGMIRVIKKVPWIRSLILGFIARLRPPQSIWQPREDDDILDFSIQPEELLSKLSTEGASLGVRLSDEAVSDVMDYAMRATCYVDREVSKPFKYIDYEAVCAKYRKEILIAQYFNTQRNCEVIRRLSAASSLKYIADRYLGVDSRLLGVNLWWTFACKPSQADLNHHAQLFHYDIDDLKFLKFFFYISEVNDEDGPHVYVEGTHRDEAFARPLHKSPRISDRWVEERFGSQIVIVKGSPGTGLVEDTYILHKGTVPNTRHRLMLQLEYGVLGHSIQSDNRG